MNASPPKSAKGRIERPSVQDRRSPKNRVIITTIKTGMAVPVIAWKAADRTATRRMYWSIPMPAAASAVSSSGPASPPVTPTRIGVPAAPKVTAVLWIIIPIMTAAAAGNPIATIRGAATAAGVPKPAAPSMKAPKSQAMMTSWTRRSSESDRKLARITETPPDSSSVFRSSSAPKMIQSKSKVRKRPWMLDAQTSVGATRQAVSATAAAARYTAGMAHFAGTRKPMSSTPASAIGAIARAA